MIRQISGTVVSVSSGSAVVEVAGFGVQVHMFASQELVVGTSVRLATHLALKQDGLELYGFQKEEDRDFFELLMTVPSVGPKTALSIFRRSPREALEGAIGKRDLTYLTKVVGLGRKSAEKMLAELVDKVGPRSHAQEDGEVFDTLVALGYTEREARRALQAIPDTLVGKEVRLKAALSQSH